MKCSHWQRPTQDQGLISGAVLVRRPAATTEVTLAEAMAYFKMLIEETTQGQIEVRYSDTTQQLPF
ncbi:hypothetical protein ABUS21_04760 [Acinetobacter baumannii]|uniref:hypothetical protein n=1 Tax=Acinetobacter baumannii TaxID=470 RepID=UPI003CFE62B3